MPMQRGRQRHEEEDPHGDAAPLEPGPVIAHLAEHDRTAGVGAKLVMIS